MIAIAKFNDRDRKNAIAKFNDRDRKNAIFLAIFAAINIVINFSRILHFETIKKSESATSIDDG